MAQSRKTKSLSCMHVTRASMKARKIKLGQHVLVSQVSIHHLWSRLLNTPGIRSRAQTCHLLTWKLHRVSSLVLRIHRVIVRVVPLWLSLDKVRLSLASKANGNRVKVRSIRYRHPRISSTASTRRLSNKSRQRLSYHQSQNDSRVAMQCPLDWSHKMVSCLIM